MCLNFESPVVISSMCKVIIVQSYPVLFSTFSKIDKKNERPTWVGLVPVLILAFSALCLPPEESYVYFSFSALICLSVNFNLRSRRKVVPSPCSIFALNAILFSSFAMRSTFPTKGLFWISRSLGILSNLVLFQIIAQKHSLFYFRFCSNEKCSNFLFLWSPVIAFHFFVLRPRQL